MSGPVTDRDEPPIAADGERRRPASRSRPRRRRRSGSLTVQRLLPRRGRRTVGPWCFADVMGPVADAAAGGIGPHPHIGLQTVTWLLAGELLHLDSLGSEQPIRPGQLNLMTAGHGVAARRGVAGLGAAARHPAVDRPARGHPPRRARLRAPRRPPAAELSGCDVTVLVGELAGARVAGPLRHRARRCRAATARRRPRSRVADDVRARGPRGGRGPVRRRRAGARRPPRLPRAGSSVARRSAPASRPWCCCSAASRSRTSW